MFDLNFYKSFLDKCNIPYPYYILSKTPQESEFKLIESLNEGKLVYPKEIPTFNHDCITEDIINKRTFLWLKYPDQLILIVAFSETVSFDNFAINMMYHLLFPIIFEISPVKRENHFENVVFNIIDILTSFDFDILINKILEKTLSIISTADAGMLWVYDSEINKLICKAYKGSVSEHALTLQLNPGEGLIGKTFLRGTPKLYSNYNDILNDSLDFSPINKKMSENIFYDGKIHSAFLMPIFVNQQIECILIIYNIRENTSFSRSDVEVLNIFSELIAITINNAKSVITIRDQLDILKKCNEVYIKLTNFSVNNAGIPKIIKELINILGISVTFINLLTNEQFPKSRDFDVSFIKMLTPLSAGQRNAFFIESDDKSANDYISPIIVGNSCLGYLIIKSEVKISKTNEMILEIGRMVIALELSKMQSNLDILYKNTSQAFFELINLNDPLALSKKCSELGIDISGNYLVITLAIISKEKHLFQKSSVHRLIANISRIFAVNQKMTFSSEEKIIVLISLQSENGISLIKNQIEEIISMALKNENCSLCAGMGSLYEGASNIIKSYHEANNALVYQLSHHAIGLMQYSEMGINQLFINLTAEEARSFLQKVFVPLRVGANQTKDYLESTLITYVESNCSMVQTAQKLYIHTNTLYQRLKKIEDCLHISFKKPEDILLIRLACYLRQSYPDIDSTI